MVLDCTWSVEGGAGCYLVILGQKIYGLHGVNHQIIEYSKKEKVMTDKSTDTQTHRHTEFPLVDSTPSVEGVE